MRWASRGANLLLALFVALLIAAAAGQVVRNIATPGHHRPYDLPTSVDRP